MEVFALGQLGETNVPLIKQNKVELDVFQELFAALFLNINTSFSIEEGINNETNKNVLEADMNLDSIPFFNSQANFFNKTSNDVKMDANEIDEILVKLGITDKKDMKWIIKDFAFNNATNESIKLIKTEDILTKINDNINSLNVPKEAALDGINILKNDEDEKVISIEKGMHIEKPDVKDLEQILKEKVIAKVEKVTSEDEFLLGFNKDGAFTANVNRESINENKVTSFITKPEDLVDVTVSKFKTLRIPGYTEVKVKLEPEELGEITVKVVLEKGKIDGSIIVEKRESYIMLQNQMDYLKQELKSNNIDFNNITINYNSSEDFNGHASRQFNHQEKNKAKDFIMDIKEEASDLDNDGFSIIA